MRDVRLPAVSKCAVVLNEQRPCVSAQVYQMLAEVLLVDLLTAYERLLEMILSGGADLDDSSWREGASYVLWC